jgi:tRNA C32,U32 (ribose-2'-O)-methylase TrmJ
VIDACHERVALPSVRYSSYNVAVAGSIVLYDRLAKERRRDAEEEAARRATEKPGIDLRYPAAGPKKD